MIKDLLNIITDLVCTVLGIVIGTLPLVLPILIIIFLTRLTGI
jgi:hypothetical protein